MQTEIVALRTSHSQPSSSQQHNYKYCKRKLRSWHWELLVHNPTQAFGAKQESCKSPYVPSPFSTNVIYYYAQDFIQVSKWTNYSSDQFNSGSCFLQQFIRRLMPINAANLHTTVHSSSWNSEHSLHLPLGVHLPKLFIIKYKESSLQVSMAILGHQIK